MESSTYLDSSFVSDVGFNQIRQWLSEQSKCKENYDYFICLEPSSNQKYLENEFKFTDELVKSLHRKDNLPHIRIGQIDRILLSLTIENECLDISEIVELKNLLYYFITLKKKFNNNHFKLWGSRSNPLDNPNSILKSIESIINDKKRCEKYRKSKVHVILLYYYTLNWGL